MICPPCVAAVSRSWMVEGPDMKRLLDKAMSGLISHQARMASAMGYVVVAPMHLVALSPSEQDEVLSSR